MNLPFALGALHLAGRAALLPLLGVPLLFAVAGGSRRARLAAGCRAFAVAAVLLALAGLRLERTRPASGTCIVAAIDVSASVGRAAVNAAGAFLTTLERVLGPNDLLGTIAFAARPHVVARPRPGRPPLATLLPAFEPRADDPDAADTDLAAAVAAARPLCPEGRETAIVMFSDGEETEGSLLAEAALTEPRVPIFAVLPPPAAFAGAAIRRLLVPRFAPAHGVVPLEVVIDARATTPPSAALAVGLSDGSPSLEGIDLAPGLRVAAVPYQLDTPGQYRVQAQLLLPPGGPPAGGPVEASITVTRPVGVLVVSEHERPVIAAALARRGMRVETIAPRDLDARSSGRIRDNHVVLLDDVPRTALPDGVLETLAQHVAGGGALIAAGGPHFFGDRGFAGTALERVLPVEFQSQAAEPEEREPIALYLLIDRSNSMGYSSSEPPLAAGEKMDFAKRAALAVLDQLGPDDLVGAVAFDSEPYELGPLRPVREGRAALARRIGQLQYGGGTDFLGALEIARRDLVAADRRVRHVVLLTDGDTNRRAEDHEAMIAALARAAITVTSIRIGADTLNLELLERISRATNGEFHHVANVRALPQLMIRDTERLLGHVSDAEHARVRVGAAGPMLAGIAEDELPPVARWALTRPKPGADVRLYAESGGRRDPLLVTWQYELGRTVVVPLDFQGGVSNWPAWAGFGKLWAQVVRWAAPAALPTDRHLDAQRTREGTLVRLETGADERGPFALALRSGPEVELHRTARRTFTGRLPPLEPGRHPAVLRGVTGPEEETTLVVPAGAGGGRESRATTPNRALLAQVAALTGGTVGPEPADVLRARPGVAREVVPLAPWLIPLAMALILGDVALRRT